MKKLLTLILLVAATASLRAAEKPDYKNPSLPLETRLADLMSRMTLDEKVGQLLCPLGWQSYAIDAKRKNVSETDYFRQLVDQQHIGMLWAVYRADPWTKKTLDNGLSPELAAKAGNALQRYVIEHTRLGIPIFLAEEAPHGHMAIGTTVFPTGIGLAATWSDDLIRQAGQVIAKEIRLQGGHISYGPVLDLAREPRWSRVEETYGEDPVLTGMMGAAMVEGLGGGDLSKDYSTIATLKHFIAYGTTEGGQNGAPSYLGTRELHENFLPPFRRAINAGALSVMTSYNSIDGIPCTVNGSLFNDLLRDDWKFGGFVVSDLYSIDGVYHTHFVARDGMDAGAMALKAGVDVDLGGLCHARLQEALSRGLVSEADINRACERVLRMKFEMGLFEHPYVEPKAAAREVRSKENVEVALHVAQASVTLLENKHHILPLRKDLKVAVVGPNADNVYNMLGDYTAPQEEGNVKTVLMGIREKLSDRQVVYAKGCAIRDTTENNINDALRAAREADVVVAVVGGSSARDFKTSYEATGAANTQQASGNTRIPDMECGEGYDRATLSLLGRQQQLLSALKATGKPLVVVYIEGRPMEKNWASAEADALLTAYYPGQEGGRAIADVLFGDFNPAGRLPFSVPRSVGQLPVYYNKKAPVSHDYVEQTAKPLYAFGYGLSYTSFDYSNLRVSGNEVTVDVRNTGDYDGEEVVQLYLHDDLASTVRPQKQLIRFARVYIKKGETKQVRFTLSDEDFQLLNRQMQWVVEPGSFKLMVGASSDDIRLETTITK